MRTNESNSPKRKTTPAATRARVVSTAAKPRKSAPRAPRAAKAPSEVRLDDDTIRVRAYEIYLQRGHHGDPMEDWLRAERELIEQRAS